MRSFCDLVEKLDERLFWVKRAVVSFLLAGHVGHEPGLNGRSECDA